MEEVFLDIARGVDERVRAGVAEDARRERRPVSRARADRHRGVAPSLRRIRALIRRHAYLLLKSWPRIVSMAYYPTVTMVLWAFLTLYLAPTNSFLADAPGFFIGAVLLWDVLFRGQLGVSLTFIEEMYSRNLGNLFVSPLRLYELHRRPAGDERDAHADRRRRRVRVRVAAVPLFDLLDGPAARRVLRLPARVRLGDRARRVGDDPALRAGRGGARMGSFSKVLFRMVSSCGGKPGFNWIGDVGTLFRIASKMTADVVPENGCLPVAIAYIMTPNENRSVR